MLKQASIKVPDKACHLEPSCYCQLIDPGSLLCPEKEQHIWKPPALGQLSLVQGGSSWLCQARALEEDTHVPLDPADSLL